MLPENEHSLYARCGAVLEDVMELPVFKQCARLGQMLTQRAKHLTWPNPRRNFSLAAVMVLPVFKQCVLFATMLTQRAKSLTWPLRRRDLTVAAVGVVLAFSGWIDYKGRGPIRSEE